jgi:outer membrane protein OmpA-like peptidoglycan-associated protein
MALFISIGSNLQSQNFVPNGDFKQNKRVRIFSTLGKLSHWYSPNRATPDYYNNRGGVLSYLQPPDKCFVGLVCNYNENEYVYVEYLSVKLNQKLTSQKRYCVSMDLLNTDAGYYALQSFDYHISINKPKGKGKQLIEQPLFGKMNSSRDSVLFKKNKWIHVCGIYNAVGNEEYLTIGYFDKESKRIQPSKRKPAYNTVYYHIDNVSLVEINDTTTCDCNYQPKKLEPLPIQVIQHTEVGENMVLENIYFATKSATIEASSFASLNNLANQLKQQPSLVLEIQGYTDNVGSDADNLELSTQRAKSVADYLITKGVLQTQVQYHGYGNAKPIAENTTEEGRQKNRRIEIKVIQK